ncbi:hypothetical protein [Alloscardovia omnicolens]|uniref:hypothetical protein n=1 Tax=Alloscardovia omnicolens TaxID=419015 RepID=UPI003A709B7E
MKKLRLGFTLGAAFARTWTVTLVVDFLMLVLASIAGFLYAQWTGLLSAVSAWFLALCFCETNAAITVLLDALKVKSRNYIVALIQLWGLKLLFVCVLGTLIITFAPLRMAVFCLVIVFTVFVCTIKNLIITATARIL